MHLDFVLNCHDRKVRGRPATTAGLSGAVIGDVMVNYVDAKFGIPRASPRRS
ncbi:MAG: hypothetical protein AB7I59_12070 [Geminicoccaceae bacterium]